MSDKGYAMPRGWMLGLLCGLAFFLLGCSPNSQATPTAEPLELIILHYEDGFPQTLLDKFTAETGITITYKTFGNYEEAEQRLLDGEVADVTWLSNNNLRTLLDRGLLNPIRYTNIPDFRYVNASFRDLSFDPGNTHHVPWSWGTTGLLYRSDLVAQPPVKWADLWTVSASKLAGVWQDRRAMFGMALMSLGYSVNTNNIAEIDEAAAFLEARWDQQTFVEPLDAYTSAYALADGTLEASLGWPYDAYTGQGLSEKIVYILPEEGTMLSLEVMVIPANSPHRANAETFINFLLQPENAAIYTNEFAYATVIDGAEEFVDPAIASNVIIFPTTAMLNNAELAQSLEPDVEKALNDHWERLMALTNKES